MPASKSSPRLLFVWILFHSLDLSQSLGLLWKQYHAEILKGKIEPKPLKTLAGLLSCYCRTEPKSTGMATNFMLISFSYEINIFKKFLPSLTAVLRFSVYRVLAFCHSWIFLGHSINIHPLSCIFWSPKTIKKFFQDKNRPHTSIGKTNVLNSSNFHIRVQGYRHVF